MTMRLSLLCLLTACLAACHSTGDESGPADATMRRGDAGLAEASASKSGGGVEQKGAEMADAAFRERVDELMQRTTLDRAIDEARRWTDQQPACVEAWQALSQCLMDPDAAARRDYREARAAAERALEACSEPTAALWVTVGTARFVSDDVEGATQAYEAALRADGELDCRAELEAFVRELRGA